MRKVIFHYHLFKNAGTSLDAAFKQTVLPNQWVTSEFPPMPTINRQQTSDWIVKNEEAVVFSSHTAMLPPPKLDQIKIVPVLFLRHPIDRIASAYAFEQKQGGDSFGAVLARNTDISGYIETRLALTHDRQCRNFHANRLSQMFDETLGSEEERAILALNTLPFVGIVEHYADSLQRLEALLKNEGFTDMSLQAQQKNVSRSLSKTLDDKLDEFKKRLRPDVYDKLIEANRADFKVYKCAKNQFGSEVTA